MGDSSRRATVFYFNLTVLSNFCQTLLPVFSSTFEVVHFSLHCNDCIIGKQNTSTLWQPGKRHIDDDKQNDAQLQPRLIASKKAPSFTDLWLCPWRMLVSVLLTVAQVQSWPPRLLLFAHPEPVAEEWCLARDRRRSGGSIALLRISWWISRISSIIYAQLSVTSSCEQGAAGALAFC